jgi:hypothetical protein
VVEEGIRVTEHPYRLLGKVLDEIPHKAAKARWAKKRRQEEECLG